MDEPWWVHSSWWALPLSLIPGAAAGFMGWRERSITRRLAAKSSERDTDTKEQERLSAERSVTRAELREDLEDRTAENRALRSDRDRGWNLARGWEALAHRLRHDLNNERASNNLAREARGLPLLSEWPDLPDIDGITPKTLPRERV